MLLSIGAIIIGLAILVWSADKFVEGATATANHLGVPILLIGMIVVGFGTSAPEMVVAAIAAMDGNPNLALGNAYGSNIANIALILGITAILAPIIVHSNIIKKEMPILLLITIFSGLIILNGEISRFEGILLLVGFVILLGWQIYSTMKNKQDSLIENEIEELEGLDMSKKEGILWLIAGIVLLIISSKILVWGAVNIATMLGVSDLIIGLTIVAIGTSLPELAAAIAAVKKGEHDLAVGNVVGSNMFNILLVIGVGATIAPMTNIPEIVFNRDFLVMLILTITLFIMAYGFKNTKPQITRNEGILLLSSFLIYMGVLTFTALP